MILPIVRTLVLRKVAEESQMPTIRIWGKKSLLPTCTKPCRRGWFSVVYGQKSIRLFCGRCRSLKKMNLQIKTLKSIYQSHYFRRKSGQEWKFNEGCLSIPGIL